MSQEIACLDQQVKAGGNAFRNNISSIKGGEKLMTLAGWRVQGDLQQDCSADQPVAGPCQPTANPTALKTGNRTASYCVARGS
eukprot:1159625-Pelagomonas_calceolata.AAC.13